MLKSVLTAGAVLFLGVATATAQTSGTTGTTGTQAGGQQMTQAECQSVWSKAGGTSDSATLSQTQAQAYVTNFDSADTNNDDKLSNAEFMAACQRGMVRDTATTGAGTGTGSTTGTKK